MGIASKRLAKIKLLAEWALIDARCFFCDKIIVDIFEVTIHHKDHNRTNNTKTNLMLSHPSCHKSYHLMHRHMITKLGKI